jgi:hypothetical protein
MEGSRTEVHFGSRLAPPDRAGLPGSVREVLDNETERFGAPLHTTMVLAHHPSLLIAYKAWSKAMSETTLIPDTLKYLVYVRVAGLNGCPF